MHLELSKPLKHQGVAEELARTALADNAQAIEQMAKNWTIALASHNLQVALAARGGLFEYLAAAHFLNQTVPLNLAATAAVHGGQALVKHFAPAPELLLVELCLAITRADRTARRELACALLGQPAEADYYNLERGQALALAALLDLDYAATERHAQRLQHAAASGEFDKHDSLLAGLWSTVMHSLARQDLRLGFDSLLLAHQEFLRQADVRLGRLKQGRDTDISAFDLVNWPAHATLRLLEDFGFKHAAVAAEQPSKRAGQ